MNLSKVFPAHILHSILKWSGWILAALIILVVVCIVTVRAVTYFTNRITAENGIDEGIFVTLGGQEQYLLIRGEDVGNPVIIWLHGGPSSPDAYVNYSFQKYLVEDYTLVNWDQRGCGRTYFRNKDTDPENKTATFDQALADLDALVDYVCGRFGKDRVILVGYSYGTMLGSKYTLDHPEKVSAYIGVGQVVSLESDIYSYRDALEKAISKGDDTHEMEGAYNAFIQDPTLMNMMQLRSKTGKYHVTERPANTTWLGIASPYMGFDDIRWFLKQAGSMEDYFAMNTQLFDYIMAADVISYGTEYQVPAGFITGSCDWTTPVKYAQDYCERISAPRKEFRLLEGCDHSAQFAAPEEFAGMLKDMLANDLP